MLSRLYHKQITDRDFLYLNFHLFAIPQQCRIAWTQLQQRRDCPCGFLLGNTFQMLSKLHQRYNNTGRFKIQTVHRMQIALQNGKQGVQRIQIGTPRTNRHQCVHIRCLVK